MKRLNRLQINPERLIKNEDLIVLRGGYGGGAACSCRIGTNTCWSDMVDNCGREYGSCYQACGYYCPNFDSLICVGA